MAVTIKDVAALAGVSTATVSRVCNGNASTARETRERVLKAIEELGYEVSSPSEPAVQPGMNIAVVLPPADRNAYENVFYLKAIRGISQVCNQRGVTTTVVAGENFEEILCSVQTLHRSKRAEGFILLYAKQNDVVVDYLCSQGLVYVVVGKVAELPDQTVCVDNDNIAAGRDATDYLYSLGHRRIGCISEKNNYFYSVDRRGGYQLSLLMHGIQPREEYAVQLEGIAPKDLEVLKNLLQKEDRPTAFVVCDDILAMALERTCAQLGLSIPKDVSLIAFNNSLYTRLSSPGLTCIDISAFELGEQAAAQLISHLENPDLAPIRAIILHKILEGESCIKITE